MGQLFNLRDIVPVSPDQFITCVQCGTDFEIDPLGTKPSMVQCPKCKQLHEIQWDAEITVKYGETGTYFPTVTIFKE